MKTLTLPFYWGQDVTIKKMEQEGTVISILLDEGSAQYKCAWYADGKRHTDWFYDFEIDKKGRAEKMKLGFAQCTCKGKK